MIDGVNLNLLQMVGRACAHSFNRNVRLTVRRYLGRISGWFLGYAGGSGAYGAGLRYLGRGEVAAAAEAFADAQRMWLRDEGPWHAGIVLAMAKRAACYVRMGRIRDAVRLYERALALARGLHGVGSERVEAIAAELAQARTFLPRLPERDARPPELPLLGDESQEADRTGRL